MLSCLSIDEGLQISLKGRRTVWGTAAPSLSTSHGFSGVVGSLWNSEPWWPCLPLTLAVPGSSLYSATLWILGELCLLLWALVTHLIDAPSFPGDDHRQIEGNSPHQNDTPKMILLFQFCHCSLLWDDIPRAPPERHLNDLPVSHPGGFSPETLKQYPRAGYSLSPVALLSTQGSLFFLFF